MRLFVTGLSGLLGINLALQARANHAVEGSVHKHGVAIAGVNAHRADLTVATECERVLARSKPDVVIHTAGLTNVDECERRPADAMRQNAEASANVAAAAHRLGIRLVHISTDHLSDGKSAFVSEDHPPKPQNAYARSKLQAERNVQAAHPAATIVRTNFYGWGTPVRASFSDWILDALRADRELGLFSDVHYTPIQINDLVDILLQLGSRDAPGVYNVVGRDRLTKYDFGLRLAQSFGFTKHRLRAVRVEDVPLPAPRPRDLSLSSKKIESFLGRPMPGVQQGLERLLDLEKNGHPKRVREAITIRPLSPN